MFCPLCTAEFRDGFTRCSDCDVDLVRVLSTTPETEYVDLVTVFEGDSAGAAVTSTILNNASIDSWIKNEGIQGIFPSLGPAEVQVRLGDGEFALEVLENAKQSVNSSETHTL